MFARWCSLTLILASVGCGSAPDVPTAGGESGVKKSADAVAEPPSRALKEIARITSQEGFGDINAIAVDGTNRVYVADAFSMSVSVFDSAGGFVRTLGRGGSGPGEFREPEGLAWRGPRQLTVIDYGNGRYSTYDTSGVHYRDERRPPLGGLWPWPGRFAGPLLVEAAVSATGYRLLRFDPETEGHPADTFPYAIHGVPLEDWEPQVWVTEGQTTRRLRIPFTAGYQWALNDEGHVWVGDSRVYKVFRRTLEGDTVQEVTREVPGVQVSPEERLRAMASLGRNPPINASAIPEFKPAFRLLLPGESGALWVLREGAGDQWLLDVFDSQGNFVEILTLPVRPYLKVLPVLSGGSLWLVEADSLGVQSVLRLNRRARSQLP